MPTRKTIVVDTDTYNQIYAIKGPGRRMQDAIRDMIEACFPTKDVDPSQEVLNTGDLCPLCETVLMEDEEGLYCPNRSCGWVED